MTAGIKANVDGSAAIQVGGTDVITLTSGGAATFVTSPTTVQAGTAAAPSITFTGDTNTGIFSPAADTIAFTEGGVESIRLNSSGNVGIGTSSPDGKLDIATGGSTDVVAALGGTFPAFTYRNGTGAWFHAGKHPSSDYFYIGNGATPTTNINMVVDSSGNVGIGTSSPAVLLHAQSTTATTNAVTQALRIDSQSSGTPANGIGVGMQFATETAAGNTEIGATIEAITTDVTAASEDFDLSFKTMAAGAAAAERVRIKSTGDFQFNSGYGSVATAYGCRAWVNFNGTGTVAIRASGNVSSITDNGTGDYTVNFSTAMPDANYSVNANNSPNFAGAFSCGAALFSNGTPTETAPTTSAARVFFGNTGGAAYDPKYACISIFR